MRYFKTVLWIFFGIFFTQQVQTLAAVGDLVGGENYSPRARYCGCIPEYDSETGNLYMTQTENWHYNNADCVDSRKILEFSCDYSGNTCTLVPGQREKKCILKFMRNRSFLESCYNSDGSLDSIIRYERY